MGDVVNPTELAGSANLSYGAPDPTDSEETPIKFAPIIQDNCNSMQIFDSVVQKCISCRDPTVRPNLTSATSNIRIQNIMTSNGLNITNKMMPGEYQCMNNPITTYNKSRQVVSYTCDSGETLQNMLSDTGVMENKCVVTFQGKY